ncbi:MAG: DUF58 domain-containing protein [Candidatus Omnitrophica bacterium]|nr:DUF58 domain-containing protein [Candidatus Omnitrophota bacterium]
MLTSRGVSLLLAVIILLAIAWNTDITMVYIFFVITFVMFILAYFHMRLNMPNIEIQRTTQETAYEDEMLNVKIKIRNNLSRGASFFEILDYFPAAEPGKEKTSLFMLEIKAKEEINFSYSIGCYRRGVWKIGPVEIISQDALGFFRMKKTLNVISNVLVYPALFRVFAFPPLASGSVSWMGVETAKISGDSHEFFGVREYQRGDAISRIHWPSTARHNKLIVKQFERNAIQEATIVLDLKKGNDIGAGKETTLEYAVKIAGSIARFLMDNGAFVQLIGYTKEAMVVPFGKGESHAFKILEYLAGARSEGTYDLSQTLEEASFITPYRSTLIAIMLDNDMDALSSLVQFKIKGIKLIVVVLASSTFGHTEESEYLDAEGAKKFDEALAGLEAHIYKVSKGDDLEKIFEMV